MKANTDVKHFRWDSPDAPVLTGENGRLIDVLDACLVNGFSSRAADSITIDNEIATVTLSGGNPYEQHAVVAITGASVAGLNAEWRIATSAASSFTFACPGVVNGVATGATIKRAGAGWAKPFSDTNIAIYQSIAPDALQLYLRVDDSIAQSDKANVRGYGVATAVDVVSDPFPTFDQTSTYLVKKSSSISADPRPWFVVADDKLFYLFIAWRHPSGLYNWWNANVFGDLIPVIDGSTGHCCIGFSGGDPSWPGQSSSVALLQNDDFQYVYRGQNPSGVSGVTQDNLAPAKFAGVSVAFTNMGLYPPGSIYSGVAYPAPNDRIDLLFPVYTKKGTYGISPNEIGIWGIHPGRAVPLQHSLPYLTDGQLNLPLFFTGAEGKLSAAMHVGGNNAEPGSMFIDISGPWR